MTNVSLILLVFVSCVTILWRCYIVSRLMEVGRGWAVISSLLLLLLFVAVVATPAYAGFIAAVPWAIFVLAPLLLSRWCGRLIDGNRIELARRIGVILAVLHPYDGYHEQPEILRSMSLAQKGRFEEAEAILNRHHDSVSPIARSAQVQLFRMQCRWEEALLWFESQGPDDLIRQDPTMIAPYLRSLGEAGRIDELWIALDRHEDPLRECDCLPAARMFGLSFSGHRPALEAHLLGPMKALAPEYRDYWLATSDLAAGREKEGREILARIETYGDESLRRAVRRRLDTPPRFLEGSLSTEARIIFDRTAEAALDHDGLSEILRR